MWRITALLAVLLGAGLASAQTVNLLAAPARWQAATDHPEATMALQVPTAEAPLAVKVVSDGGRENYPKLRLQWDQPQDWSRYARFRARVRVNCTAPGVTDKQVTFVFYDDQVRHQDLPDHPMVQQCLGYSVPVNQWFEIKGWLLGLKRGSIAQLDMYLYEVPPANAHTYTWEFADLALEGMGETGSFFDTEIYGSGGLHRGKLAAPVGRVGTADGLQLELDRAGGLRGVSLDRKRVGGGGKYLSGLLVRDAATDDPPVMVGGTLQQQGLAVTQAATLAKQGLKVAASYRPVGDYLEVAGKVTDLRRADRAVTVSLAIPVDRAPWQWWDNVATARTQANETGELMCVETGAAYGQNGMHSKYPLGAISDPARGGLTLGIRMDEPVVHRVGYNPGMGLLFLSVDLGLTPVKTVKGKSLSEAPFRFLVYRHDPAWGMRSALQRYYRFFPQFFTNRIPAARQGGWFVWGKMQDMAGALDAGFGFHWGPSGPDAVKWDNQQGPLALQYIEAEFYQQTMGDYKDAPSYDECIARFRKIAAGDEAEMQKYLKLNYASSYLPGKWIKEHSLREAVLAVNRACANSVEHSEADRPYGGVANMPWIGNSNWGIIFPCSLDPDIPEGKGHFCKDLYLETGLREMTAAGAHYDGIGLDSFGGYGQLNQASFRRELFQYSDVPLTFSTRSHKPVQVCSFNSVEWVRELARDMHARKLVLMANCSWGTTPAWLTFAAPYLDIQGAEAPRFADPEFARAISYHKPCTDLPYDPRPDWEVARNQLYGIFPGHGNKVEVMARFAPTFRALAAAGWEPVTGARASVPGVRLERYGTGPGMFLVLHNPGDKAAETTVTVDLSLLGLKQLSPERVGAGAAVTAGGNGFSVGLAGLETVVVRLR